jgi:hypothetical protein
MLVALARLLAVTATDPPLVACLASPPKLPLIVWEPVALGV